MESHKKFKAKHKLNFSLLSDIKAKVIKAYGVWQEKMMYGKKKMGISRTTFVIDEKGTIERVYPKVKVKGHVKEVVAGLKKGKGRAG